MEWALGVHRTAAAVVPGVVVVAAGQLEQCFGVGTVAALLGGCTGCLDVVLHIHLPCMLRMVRMLRAQVVVVEGPAALP